LFTLELDLAVLSKEKLASDFNLRVCHICVRVGIDEVLVKELILVVILS